MIRTSFIEMKILITSDFRLHAKRVVRCEMKQKKFVQHGSFSVCFFVCAINFVAENDLNFHMKTEKLEVLVTYIFKMNEL